MASDGHGYDQHSSLGFLHLSVTDILYWLILCCVFGRGGVCVLCRTDVLCKTDVLGDEIRTTEISFTEG